MYWNHPKNLTEDGTFSQYTIDCTAEFNTTAIPSTTHTTGWKKEFVVAPVTPFRTYTCEVTPVLVANGPAKPTAITLETLQDSELAILCAYHAVMRKLFSDPDGPPRDVTVDTIDSKILQISWTPPEVPNGIITYHRLYIDYTNTTRIYEIDVPPQYNIFFLEFLYPNQRVGISVSATTGGGEGPASSYVFNRTHEAGGSFYCKHILI